MLFPALKIVPALSFRDMLFISSVTRAFAEVTAYADTLLCIR